FLFGASMLLVIEQANAKSENARQIHYRRMFWLLIFGLIHLYLIWWGDILSHYALIGMVAWFFRNKPVPSLIKWGIGLLVVEMILMSLLGSSFVMMSMKASDPNASAEALRQWQEMQGNFGVLAPAKLAENLALYDGNYAGIAAHRLETWFSPLIMIGFVGWETLAYFLFGMAAYKSGFLTGQWDRARYKRWMLMGYAISIPAFAILAWINIAAEFDTATVAVVGLAGATPFRPAMIIAHAALIILLTAGGGALVGRIAAAGRAAFTNYIGTSILMTTFFYGYGLSYYGDMGRAEVYLVVLAMWAVILLWSKPWLDRYRYGPLEWLWRTLARGSVQPLRKDAPAAA
ncbi:MAG: DUF418 domain-containing protein, partial [Pseudomonadota bacterium]|nr:DUF418 domain-containing protein [Pseudomonadota bacterium]